MAPALATYEPRDPSRTVLYTVIADHLETFLASCEADPEPDRQSEVGVGQNPPGVPSALLSPLASGRMRAPQR
jgi:hypothetical protein